MSNKENKVVKAHLAVLENWTSDRTRSSRIAKLKRAILRGKAARLGWEGMTDGEGEHLNRKSDLFDREDPSPDDEKDRADYKEWKKLIEEQKKEVETALKGLEVYDESKSYSYYAYSSIYHDFRFFTSNINLRVTAFKDNISSNSETDFDNIVRVAFEESWTEDIWKFTSIRLLAEYSLAFLLVSFEKKKSSRMNESKRLRIVRSKKVSLNHTINDLNAIRKPKLKEKLKNKIITYINSSNAVNLEALIDLRECLLQQEENKVHFQDLSNILLSRVTWLKKEKEEREEREEKERKQPYSRSGNAVDYEYAVMSAIENGEGDRIGY